MMADPIDRILKTDAFQIAKAYLPRRTERGHARSIKVSLLFSLALIVLAAYNTAGCVDPPDENVGDGVVDPMTPVEPVPPTVVPVPPAPTEPKPLCGTEVYAIPSTEVPTDFPLELGHPFYPIGPDVAATVTVVPNVLNDRIDLTLSYSPGEQWAGTVGYGWNRPADGFATLTVEDVIVHDGFVSVVWNRVFYGDVDENPATPHAYISQTWLSVIDAEEESVGSPSFLTSDPYKTHRIAWDGARYQVVEYDPNFRTVRRATVSAGIDGAWESVVTLDINTAFAFESVQVDADDTLHAYFREVEDYDSALRVDNRSCQ